MSTETRLTDPTRDEADIQSLWRRNFGEVPEERFQWLYRSTPDAASLYLGLWNDKGQLVGGAGIIPRSMRSDSGNFLAGQAVDLVVDRAYRSAGPAIKVHRDAMDHAAQAGMNVLYGFPIPASEAVLRRLRYKVLGIYGRWVKPLRYHYLLKKRLPTWLAPAAAFLLDQTTRLVARDTWSRLPKGWSNSILDAPDERFNAFWALTSPRLGLAGRRDREFLEWRFFRQPGHHRKIFTINDEADQLKAYLVFQESSDGFIQILDFLATGERELGVMFDAFSRYARARKAKSLTAGFLGRPQTVHTLKQAGFVQRDNADAKVLLSAADEGFHDPERWYLTDADRDT